MRRLNRTEYDNTVRDLLGTALEPGNAFLNDAPEFGFDNNADQMTISPVLMGLYQQASEALAAEAMAPAARSRLVTCDLGTGEACIRTIVSDFGSRAYRRPLLPSEVDAYVALADAARGAGATADESLRTIVEAMLVSPHFLFRVELDADPTSLTPHAVGPYEMASRLSYLLYRSMPDAALFDAAAAGQLSDPASVVAAVERMLSDPKGSTFAQDFPAQWLGTRRLATAQFDPAFFPSFTPTLAASMQAELGGFFEEFVREDRPVRELITADFSYLDDTLARHYGLPAVGSSSVRRTVLNSPNRGGLLGMAATLATTSYPTRTSLVKRGAWVLGELLCAEPAPPPPDVVGLPADLMTATTQKELLARHRSDPSCAGCHEVMDNIGIGLENYDALGAWRTTENGIAIDASGVYDETGEAFNGPRELAAAVANDPRLQHCFAERLLTYALGRSVGAADEPYLADISRGIESGNVRVHEVLKNLVASEPFRLRRGELP